MFFNIKCVTAIELFYKVRKIYMCNGIGEKIRFIC